MTNKILWVIQVLLSALFLFAGSMKLAMPIDSLFGLAFFKFIGVAEVLGAIGLLIPRLTSLAAAGLAIIMVGAVTLTLSPVPAVAGLLLAAVAWNRLPPAWRSDLQRSIRFPASPSSTPQASPAT